jgi:hypothetical protein
VEWAGWPARWVPEEAAARLDRVSEKGRILVDSRGPGERKKRRGREGDGGRSETALDWKKERLPSVGNLVSYVVKSKTKNVTPDIAFRFNSKDSKKAKFGWRKG